jgi:hypothetical protein
LGERGETGHFRGFARSLVEFNEEQKRKKRAENGEKRAVREEKDV